MPMLEISTGATLFYEDLGDPAGTPLIAIHGWLGTGRYDLGNVIDWLASEGFRVLAPTRRGYGQSLPKPRDYPYDFYHRDARDMFAFMDALNIDKAHILGYSDGGETALCMATMQPERPLTVCVWGAGGSFIPELRARVQSNYPATWMDEATRQLNGLTTQAQADALVLGWINAIKYMIDAGGDISLSKAHLITCPLLIMLGDRDTLNPPIIAQRFIEKAKQGRLVMFPCGHPVHDQQWEGFQREVRQLLGLA